MLVQVYAPTTSHPEEDINRFYNDVAETLGKSNHVNAQIRIKYKIMNTVFQKKAMTWTNPKGVSKAEIDYILTSSPSIVTDVTGINQVNIGSDHILVMSNIGRIGGKETLMTKRPPRADATQIVSKKIEFHLELRKRFKTLQELDDIDTMSETIADMIQQGASRIAKEINTPLKSRMSSPIKALMTKR